MLFCTWCVVDYRSIFHWASISWILLDLWRTVTTLAQDAGILTLLWRSTEPCWFSRMWLPARCSIMHMQWSWRSLNKFLVRLNNSFIEIFSWQYSSLEFLITNTIITIFVEATHDSINIIKRVRTGFSIPFEKQPQSYPINTQQVIVIAFNSIKCSEGIKTNTKLLHQVFPFVFKVILQLDFLYYDSNYSILNFEWEFCCLFNACWRNSIVLSSYLSVSVEAVTLDQHVEELEQI